jgi:uncharacterized repeat protein (TIGR03803 family)
MPPLSSGAEGEELDMKKCAPALVFRSIAAILPLTLAAASAAAQGVTVIANFGQTPADANQVDSPLVFDKAGNLYGVTDGSTPFGTGYRWGTIFKMTKKPDGVWTRTVLYNLTGEFDKFAGPLVLDASGNLYGEIQGVDNSHNGRVFELSPSGEGTWTMTDLYDFTGSPDGSFPLGGVIFDSAGNLYGTTLGGGACNCGTIFKLTPQQGGGWKESVIHSFVFDNGEPSRGLTIDHAGNLYGTTAYSDPPNYIAGVVYELSPGSDGAWSYTILHAFPGSDPTTGKTPDGDGSYLYSPVILDADGNIFGTTVLGGTYGYGSVFEIPAGHGPNRPDKILYSFSNETVNHGGYNPLGGLVFDHAGNLYGTTYYGGLYDGGKIFEMLPKGDGTWAIKDLHDFGGQKYNGFTGIDGQNPYTSMVFGPDGNLYGTTNSGGYQPKYPVTPGGVAFELKLH